MYIYEPIKKPRREKKLLSGSLQPENEWLPLYPLSATKQGVD